MKRVFTFTPVALAVFLAGCNDDTTTEVIAPEYPQAQLSARAVNLINSSGYQFKDLNKNDKLDVYEDWRKPVDERIDDLVSQMTLEEKVGMMLIDTMNSAAYGRVTSSHVDYIEKQMMNRFIFRNPILTKNELDAMDPALRDPASASVGGRASAPISPYEAAQYMNMVQELSEATRLGIPALFKSNARNHNDPNAKPGINVSAGAFSEWPKEAGLASASLGEGNMELIGEFADIMNAEWKAIGLRGMYGYMADLSTEPRWYRVHETFTEDSALAADIMTSLVTHLQGKKVDSNSIVLTMKHFPGGGPQFLGLDPHYLAGQHQSYPTGNFDYHVKPFKAAIDAGVAALMPYYGVVGGGEWKLADLGQGETVASDGTNLYVGTDKNSGIDLSLVDVTSERVQNTARVPYNKYSTTVGTPAGNVGVAFSKGILDDLLRDELGFTGVINSDTGIINEPNVGLPDTQTIQNNRAWGLQDKTKDELFQTAINAGTDVFSGFHKNADILNVVKQGLVSEDRIDESVKRLLKVQFELGLFENPYVDPVRAEYIVGNEKFQDKAREAQRKSVVLLDNKDSLLPLPAGDAAASKKLYTLGVNEGVAEQYGYQTVTTGDASDLDARPSAANHDYALIRVRVTNKDTGLLVFGGADFKEVDVLDFTSMAASNTWEISPSLADIQAVMSEVGAENTVLSVYFRQPFVMDGVSGLKDAGAILATFGSKDNALMDVVTGKFNPSGKLPFALANSAQAIIDQASDAPGYAAADTLYPFGHGLSYSE
ncbi:MAG: glycoside hydrolase family 3 N-terminal domain-containing protein [Photobacterium sp.]|nr:glycoside hydrolase family 3 N-terminal domain-containing protein [Photobacterium sp.]MDX1304387.1 glycoside hydrolase family 3 N-terminal domain-containing protein [Photobacterium sp.]